MHSKIESVPATLRVVAAALRDAQGRFLIACRPPGKSSAGRWEFPGGKIDAEETPVRALLRELHEELGIEAAADAPCFVMRIDERQTTADGSLRQLELHCFLLTDWRGEPAALDGQTLAWVRGAELSQYDILEADAPFVAALQRL